MSKIMSSLTPKEIVEKLSEYIVGQVDAKKAVAVALRNRWRRRFVEEELRDEIIPKNILMIGPTGVGKTEIARRIAKIVQAPFIKVEATKFTEIGYVGRDVESIIRELLDIAMNMVRKTMRDSVENIAKEKAYNRILNVIAGEGVEESTREYFREQLMSGKLDDKEIEIKVQDSPAKPAGGMDVPGMNGVSMGVVNIGEMLGKMGMGDKMKTSTMTVAKAIERITSEESDKIIDEDQIVESAISLVETESIVFLDEIDKICGRGDTGGGSRSEISREGVQRDLLPLIEGTVVNTKHGSIKTDHILFISSGAFHLSKPSDLLPELQGRFPIRVKLKPLTFEDMVSILTQTKASLPTQYKALIEVEGVDISFESEALDEIARLAIEYNNTVENLGARRLHGLLESIFEDIAFDASEKKGEKFVIDKKYVTEKIKFENDDNYTDMKKLIL